jgi:hypothetical protein
VPILSAVERRVKAGFARQKITPPLGARLMGTSRRDGVGGCTAVHDDLFVRTLYLEGGGEEVLIACFDLCFLGREEADRFRGAAGRTMGLLPRQLLLSTTHTHAGPSVGTWAHAGYAPPDRLYLDELQAAFLRASARAKETARDATLHAGRGRTRIPLSRRRIREDGTAAFAPAPKGFVYDALPVVVLRDEHGACLCAIVSASCHPSTACGFEVSADYPGAALAILDERLGGPVSMFLQGAGGDAKVAMSAGANGRWIANDWNVVEQAGRTLAAEALGVIEGSLSPVAPALRSAIVEVELPLRPPPSRAVLEAAAAGDSTPAVGACSTVATVAGGNARPTGTAAPSVWEQGLRTLWARRQLEMLHRRGALPTSAPILVQEVQLGEALRLVAIEGEPVAELGAHVESCYSGGLTIPVGYANGQGLYLPVSHMLAEGGYEVESFYEYGLPAGLAEGAEIAVTRAIERLADTERLTQ